MSTAFFVTLGDALFAGIVAACFVAVVFAGWLARCIYQDAKAGGGPVVRFDWDTFNARREAAGMMPRHMKGDRHAD